MSENFFPFIVVGGFAVVLISVVISIALEEGETGGSFLMAKKPTYEELEQRVKWTQKDYDDKPLLYDKIREDMRHNFTAILSQEFLTYFF